MKATLLILVFIAGVALGWHPDAFPRTRALLRSVIQGGKKSDAPRAARRYSGFSRTSDDSLNRFRGRGFPAVPDSRLLTEPPRLIDAIVVESSINPNGQSSVVPPKFRKIVDEEPDLARSINIVQSIDEELATKFTIEACKYFETFDCDETCNLCKLCDTPSGSQRPECSKQCARGVFNCKQTCKAGQEQCSSLAARYSNGVTNRFSRLSSEFVPQTTDVSQFAGMADFTKESCQYFGVFNCKETCGLCTMCDDTQQAKDRAECKTLCTLGVDDCTKACEAGQERCSGFATTPKPVVQRSKTVPPEIDNEVATQFTVDACKYFANFNCEETCGMCNLCDQPGFDSNRPECSTQCAGGEVKCTASCKAGQEQCLLLASRFSDTATGIIPMGTDFADFSKMAEFTVESCDYFASFNCKDTCGLCKLCDVIPGGSNRPECNTLCNAGVDTCTALCEAGQARCARSPQLLSTPAPEPIVVSKAVETQFTVDSCKYFASFDCDETCGLCSLCGSSGFDAPECSSQCVGGIEKCKQSCKAGQNECVSLASRFADAATSVIPMNTDFTDFSALSELAIKDCDYFMSFNCKESCGLCNLCNLVPGGSKRTECTTLCASGINTCTSVCEAGQARCANVPQLATTPAPKAVAVTHEDVAEFTVQSCKYFAKFNCQKSCGLCKFCSIPGMDKTRPECKKYCKNGIEACTHSCIAGQAKCFEFISPISDLSVAIDAGALSAAITVESCELFGEYTCKDTCGLCNLCNLAPGGSDRPECTTLCNLGIDKCYSVCEAGKAKCSAFSPSTTTSIQTKAVVPRTSNNQNNETEISMEACKFDCEKTCDLCDLCTPDSTEAKCSTLCKLGKEKCSEYCTNGQERCLKYFADFYRQKSNFFSV